MNIQICKINAAHGYHTSISLRMRTAMCENHCGASGTSSYSCVDFILTLCQAMLLVTPQSDPGEFCFLSLRFIHELLDDSR